MKALPLFLLWIVIPLNTFYAQTDEDSSNFEFNLSGGWGLSKIIAKNAHRTYNWGGSFHLGFGAEYHKKIVLFSSSVVFSTFRSKNNRSNENIGINYKQVQIRLGGGLKLSSNTIKIQAGGYYSKLFKDFTASNIRDASNLETFSRDSDFGLWGKGYLELFPSLGKNQDKKIGTYLIATYGLSDLFERFKLFFTPTDDGWVRNITLAVGVELKL